MHSSYKTAVGAHLGRIVVTLPRHSFFVGLQIYVAGLSQWYSHAKVSCSLVIGVSSWVASTGLGAGTRFVTNTKLYIQIFRIAFMVGVFVSPPTCVYFAVSYILSCHLGHNLVFSYSRPDACAWCVYRPYGRLSQARWSEPHRHSVEVTHQGQGQENIAVLVRFFRCPLALFNYVSTPTFEEQAKWPSIGKFRVVVNGIAKVERSRKLRSE